MAVKYPNPKFFRLKDNINWKAQLENIKEVGAIAGQMLKDTDWKAFGKKQKENLDANVARIKKEAKMLAGMTNAERLDLLLNGEKQLGKLYRSGCMATVRREWRGVKDTGVDFYELSLIHI